MSASLLSIFSSFDDQKYPPRLQMRKPSSQEYNLQKRSAQSAMVASLASVPFKAIVWTCVGSVSHSGKRDQRLHSGWLRPAILCFIYKGVQSQKKKSCMCKGISMSISNYQQSYRTPAVRPDKASTIEDKTHRQLLQSYVLSLRWRFFRPLKIGVSLWSYCLGEHLFISHQ